MNKLKKLWQAQYAEVTDQIIANSHKISENGSLRIASAEIERLRADRKRIAAKIDKISMER